MANIAIPIEIKTREFDGKLWLATQLAESGHRVAIGYRNPMRDAALHDIEPDLFLTKAAAKSSSRLKLFHELQKYECDIAVLDAEGGVMNSPQDYFEKRISEDILQSVDLFFAWGNEPAEVIREMTSFPDEKLIISGNPRFDLLHSGIRDIYSDEADRLRDEFEKYVLINTNFARANHKDPDYSYNSNSKTEYIKYILDEFIELIPELANISQLDTVIIRPHPSENPDLYNEEFSTDSSVVINQSGDVRAWILGAKAVLHNSCTTGIESAMLNTPVLSFEPNNAPVDSPRPTLPNFVSKSVSNLDNLISDVRSYVKEDVTYQLSPEQQSQLKKYFANVDEPATEKIVNAMSSSISSSNLAPTPSLTKQAKTWAKHGELSSVVETLMSRDFDRSDYSKQKFPGLSLAEVQARISDFEKVSSIENIRAKPVNRYHDIYWVYKE